MLKHLIHALVEVGIQKPQYVVEKITHKLLCDFELPTFASVRCLSINKWCYLD